MCESQDKILGCLRLTVCLCLLLRQTTSSKLADITVNFLVAHLFPVAGVPSGVPSVRGGGVPGLSRAASRVETLRRRT